ncbi:MAG: NrtA/SsuA/CpmA family ABC transporter substrate-binding protein [Deltaproteobacteria bacterium]|nr:NrtA/SsuA/CpmA family ABC transporter substrate-binding protein [Deltaproteobacteria bacterium]
MRGISGSAHIAASLLLLAVASFATGCDRGPARTGPAGMKKITIAVTPWPASVALYIAQEKGYFREEGLDATLDSYLSGHLGINAVLSGKADIATSTETPIARAALEGKRLAVIATVAEVERGMLIVARKDRGISKPGDLKGKKVGRVAWTAADFFLDIYLTTSSVDPGKVRIVDLAPEQVVRSLLDGEVDAVSTWPPQTTILREKLGSNGVVLHEPGLYTMTWNVVTSMELSGRDPDMIARFLRAILKANRLIDERPEEAMAIAVKCCGMSMSDFGMEWTDMEFTLQLDQTLLSYLEDQARWMNRKGTGGAGKAPNFLDHIDAKGLRAVRPEAVLIVGK